MALNIRKTVQKVALNTITNGFPRSSSKRTPDETDRQDEISFQRSRFEGLISETQQINERSQIKYFEQFSQEKT